MTLNKKHSQTGSAGADARRAITSQIKIDTLSGCSSSMSLSDMMEPPDWEDLSVRLFAERDPLAYPPGDVELVTIPRRIRTINHILPDEDLNEAPLYVRECVRCYTSNWIAAEYKFRQNSGSSYNRERLAERMEILQRIPRQQYEVDIDPMTMSISTEELTLQQCDSQPSSGRQSVSSISSSSSCNETLTPRGSWASLDLRSSSSDPLLPDLLERRSPEQMDQLNESRRMDGRQLDLLGLYTPYIDDEEAVERRLPAEIPCELMGHRILVQCQQLKLELEVEPMFASMALYDAKEKRKLSENFYFNLNSESLKQTLSAHIPYVDLSTLSRSAVFDILNPSSDLFLVVRLEKVLQGDITECVEPYIKEDKNREKIRAAALAACERLGKYRMPFAWTAVSIVNILSGSNSLEREQGNSDKDSLSSNSQSNSLDRKASTCSLEQLRRRAGEVGGSLTRKGSLERRAHAPSSATLTSQHSSAHLLAQDDMGMALDTFKPIGITITSFFKQESDKMRDEDLYKFLQEIKRPSSAPKKLKCIPGMLKVEISPCPDEIRNGLTPELMKLHPYGDEKVRPCKETLPFPLLPVLLPHYQYRNLVFVCPKELNFTAYTSRTGSARNIAVRIQLMAGESQEHALKSIFGRSACPEFGTEAFTAVTYHNKNPYFYDEVKIKLPANLSDQHHLLFTFYHISCQRKPVAAPELEKTVETPIGYSWLPLCRNGKLSSGEFNLPVMQEEPPPNYSYIFPDVLLPGTKWIDNHKPIFSLTVDPYSTVHPLDSNLERFAMACEAVLEGNIPTRIGISNMEAELRSRFDIVAFLRDTNIRNVKIVAERDALYGIVELANANPEALVKSLPVVLDKLVRLLVAPPLLLGQTLNIAQDVFTTLTQLFTNVTNLNDGATCDSHGRSSLLTTYIHYQCLIPRSLASADQDVGLPITTTPVRDNLTCKILHEELALQWVVASGITRDLAMQNSWTLFELIVKSMLEYIWWSGGHEAPRKSRFPEQFTDDVTTLVSNVTSEIISRYGKNGKLTQSLNNSLAFFLFDLLSIMDRGFVFGLIRTYYKQMSAKIASLPDAVPLIHYKLAFLRIICSHEHYVSLNLPCGTAYTSGPVSPSPSAHSLHSHTSAGDRAAFSELSPDFRHQHFLTGLLLSELANVLEIQSPVLQSAGVSAVLALLTTHDADPRLLLPEVKARVAAIYLPILNIVMDVFPQLYRGFFTNKDRLQLGDEYNPIGQLYTATSTDGDYNKTSRAPLNSETTRNLLVCWCWVLKWLGRGALAHWCADLTPPRVYTLLQVLDLCFACFEYKGQKEIQRCSQQNVRKTTDIKARLEDVILGQGSARSELIMRRKGCNNTIGERRERWRKDWAPRGAGRTDGSAPPSLQGSAHLEGSLSAELALTLLHTLELVVQVCTGWEAAQTICGGVLQVLLRAMQRNESTSVLQHMFATQRSLIQKFQWLCVAGESEGTGALCRVLLRHCAALAAPARAHASATLYALMRQNYDVGNNFSRVKMQVTMSLSSLVGTSATFSEESLRRALKTILLYAEQDSELQETSFPEQVKDLVFNLHMILSDTVKMKEFQEDPEMLLDLMHRIARGYQHSPDLRLTWLNNMAQKHMERLNHTEAAMCLVAGAALVAERLCAGGAGAALLQAVTPNALDESAAADDPHATPSQHLSENALQALLEHAAGELHAAGMYEAVNEVYKVLIPIAEANRDYKKLANIHGKLNEAYTRIEQLHGKRVFGTYFRVSFYGSKFGDLNGEEFIYKEPTLTKLPEIFSRLENFYSQRFGTENVVIIKDSNTVDVSTLDPDKAYIQITYVEPYFEPYELRHRITHFERNFNIKRFIYATPFTTSGRAHGELNEQCKRKTILTTSHHFPYVKTRIQVVNKTQMILSPIEVAIEDMQKKINELAAATSQDPPDPKILQMVVQGCIGTTVNQGPGELAQVFLGPVADGTQPPTKFTNKLRLCFKDFSKKCHDALKKNKNLIGMDQREYQRELERNYQRFTERLAPLIQMTPGHVAQLSNGLSKADWKFHA